MHKILPSPNGLPGSVSFIVEKDEKTYYAYEWQHPSVAATVVLRNSLSGKFLLIRRAHPPFENHLAFPGGFLDVGKESIEETASRELKEETGISIPPTELTLIDVRSHPNRDPRDHAFDIAYFAETTTDNAKALDETLEVVWLDKSEVDERMDLAFDHDILWKNTKDLLEI